MARQALDAVQNVADTEQSHYLQTNPHREVDGRAWRGILSQ